MNWCLYQAKEQWWPYLGTPGTSVELLTYWATTKWLLRDLSQIHSDLEVRRMMPNTKAAAFFRNISDLIHRYHLKALATDGHLDGARARVWMPCATREGSLPYTCFLHKLSSVNKETQKQIHPIIHTGKEALPPVRRLGLFNAIGLICIH